MTSLVDDEPDFAMGLVLAAYMSLTSTDAIDLDGARQLTDQLDSLALNDREAAHRAALQAWTSGDWHGAARLLDDLLACWPADLLGLLVGHQLDFFLGDAANLRDRVGRSLPHIDQAHPHHAFAQGMYAFGLEESGDYPLAEHHGLAALDRNHDDVWATHAVTHVYEMQGRIDEGIRFLRTRQADWGDGQPVRRPQLVASGPVPARSRRHGRVARHLRPAHPQRPVRRSTSRDARRQRPAVATAPRPSRRRRSLRPTCRRMVNPHHTANRGTCSTTCTP